MTQELTREFLEEAGFISARYWFDEWVITRYWSKTSNKEKSFRQIKVHNAKCKHKYTHDKFYPIISFCVYQRRYCFSLSKFLYAWFRGKVPAGYDVDHIDNDPYNNYITEDPNDPKTNLRLLTRAENIKKRLEDNPDSWVNQYGGKKK